MPFTTATLINAIENLGPDEYPSLVLQARSRHDLLHQHRMTKFHETRVHVYKMGATADPFFSDAPLGVVVAEYSKDIKEALRASDIQHRNEVAEIKDSTIVKKAEIDATHRNHFASAYRSAVKQCNGGQTLLLSECKSRHNFRAIDLRGAKELMHRQLIMHAFFTCGLSWNVHLFLHKGVYHGFFKNLKIQAWRLEKHVDDSPDGVYRLQLEWTPTRGATQYPAHLHVDRIEDGHFGVQHIEWKPYYESVAEYDAAADKNLPRAKVDIVATIRCCFVAAEQDAERAAKEKAELDEEKYKKTLPAWKILTYKEGDYQKSRAYKSQL